MKTLLTVLAILSILPASAQTNATATATNAARQFKPYVPRPVAAPLVKAQTNQITIRSIDDVLATYYKCSTSSGQMYLQGLPANVKAAHDKVARLTAFTTREEAALKQAWRDLNREKAIAPSSASAANPDAYNWIGRLNVRENQLDERDAALAEARHELAAARQDLSETSRIHAMPTGRNYAGLPIWQVVPAPSRSRD